MFTGIIEELGEVVSWDLHGDAGRLTVRGPVAVSDAKHGDSISVNGVCLTVVDQGADWFTADVMAESIRMSTLETIATGDRVNLERAAQVGARLGGHIVQGHIDGTARLLSIAEGSAWRVLRFALDPAHAPLVVGKGSIAVDGVSLTVSAVSEVSTASAVSEVSAASAVSEVSAANNSTGQNAAAADGVNTRLSDGSWFEVSLIPETLAVTTLGLKAVGDFANIETDILARHVARLAAFGTAPPGAAASDLSPATPERTLK